MQRQWSIAASGAMKLEVRRDGWYRVTRSRLARAGAKLSSSRSPRLFADGKEVPIYVSAGAIESTALLAILRRPTRAPTGSSTERPAAHASPSRRQVLSAAGLRAKLSVHARQEVQDDHSTLPNGERQNYFGDQIFSSPTTLHVTVQNLARGSGPSTWSSRA